MYFKHISNRGSRDQGLCHQTTWPVTAKCMCAHKYVCLCCLCACLSLCAHACTSVCVHVICVYMFVLLCTWTCVCARMCMQRGGAGPGTRGSFNPFPNPACFNCSPWEAWRPRRIARPQRRRRSHLRRPPRRQEEKEKARRKGR